MSLYEPQLDRTILFLYLFSYFSLVSYSIDRYSSVMYINMLDDDNRRIRQKT